MKLILAISFALAGSGALGFLFGGRNFLFPDFNIALITAFSLMSSSAESLIAGLLCGFFKDSFLGRFFGYYSFLLAGVGLFCAKLRKVFCRLWILSAICAFSFCFLGGLLSFFNSLNGGFLGEREFVLFIKSLLLPKCFFTAGASLLFFFILKKIFENKGFRPKKRAAIRKQVVL